MQSMSGIYPFVAKIVILMVSAFSISIAIKCDHSKQYPVHNGTFQVLMCMDCRECTVGYEPKVPCGVYVLPHIGIGDCRPCPSGTYSPDRDVKACKTCKRNKCFKHQLFKGECVPNKEDLSYCLNECETGYHMNDEKTACILHVSHKNMTNMANVTSKIPKVTTTNHQVDGKSSGLTAGVIAAITVAIVSILVFVAFIVWFCFGKCERGDREGAKGDDSSASTVVLVDPIGEPNVFPTQEMSKMVSPDIIISPNTLPENPGASSIANDRNMVGIHTTRENNPVALGILVQSSGDISLPPTITPTQNPHSSVYVAKRLEGDTSYKICGMIYDCFDCGPIGKDWRALAGWLNLSFKEVRRIENEQYRTQQIIQIWAAKKENDLQKFLQILNDKGMTQLAAQITEEMAA